MHFVFSSYFCINNISRPHTMHFLKYILPAFLFLSITGSCDNNEGATSLGENEYYLGERLVSLSMDADSTFWIGGETGRILLHITTVFIRWQHDKPITAIPFAGWVCAIRVYSDGGCITER